MQVEFCGLWAAACGLHRNHACIGSPQRFRLSTPKGALCESSACWLLSRACLWFLFFPHRHLRMHSVTGLQRWFQIKLEPRPTAIPPCLMHGGSASARPDHGGCQTKQPVSLLSTTLAEYRNP